MVGLWPGGLALAATTAEPVVLVLVPVLVLVLVQAARVSRMMRRLTR
jgi:predicted lysophospholipase L1 biosynthesis ABC-type transport system permease subunit